MMAHPDRCVRHVCRALAGIEPEARQLLRNRRARDTNGVTRWLRVLRRLCDRASNPSLGDPLVKDLVEVGWCPASDLAAKLDGFGVFGGSHEIEGEVADHGHVPCPESLAQT